MVVSCNVDAGNSCPVSYRIQLWKSNQCSEQLTHLSSLTNVFLASGNSARIMSQNMEFKEWGPVERH